jgi:hypothetical protein
MINGPITANHGGVRSKMVLSRGGTQGYGGDSLPAMILWSGFCPSGLIVVKLWVVVCVFASVKLAKLDEPAWTDHGGRSHPTAAMVPRSRRDRMRRQAITFCDMTMSLK